ncbi:MAG: tetratricopeptide repeat protein [Chlorobiota bacterium]
MRSWGIAVAVVVVLSLGSWLLKQVSRPVPASATAGEPELPQEQQRRLSMLQQQLAQDSTNLVAVLELANLYYDIGRFTEAVPLYQRYLAADPGQAEVRIDYAYALFASGQQAAGIRELRRVLERFPDHPIALFNLGVLLAQSGDLQGARQSFEELIRLHPVLPLAERARQALRTIDSLQASSTKP